MLGIYSDWHLLVESFLVNYSRYSAEKLAQYFLKSIFFYNKNFFNGRGFDRRAEKDNPIDLLLIVDFHFFCIRNGPS